MKSSHKIKNILFFLCFSCILFACDESETPTANLLFSSGFEGDIKIGELKGGFRSIEGTDSETGFNWPINIFGESDETGIHYINDNNYLNLKTEIQVVEGHDGKQTNALYSEVTCSFDDKTQCLNTDTQNPYEISDIKDGKRDLYIRYWVKLDSTSYKKLDGWRTFFEWKTKTYADGSGFRLISYIYSDENNPNEIFWHWQGDHDANAVPDWEFDNRDVPVPLDKWFLTEFYWSWNEGNGGRALWKIDGHVIKDYLGPTEEEPDLAPALPDQAVDLLILTQIYGDSNPKYQWIDDIEIWDGIPSE